MKTRKKISKSEKGKIISNQTRQKLSKAFQGRKSNLWIDGRSFKEYGYEWTKKLREFIRKRDKFKCQICYNKGNNVHHIDYDKKNHRLSNLITLCNSCHAKTEGNKDFWKKYFKVYWEDRK